MEIAKGIIGNALTSAATDHVVAVSNDVYDEHLEKYQSEINANVAANDIKLDSVSLAANKITELLSNTTFSDSTELVQRLITIKSELDSLGNGYKTLKEVSQTLKNFITAADTSNQTINTWKEIETFLNGITDTDTLTGLLKELKDELESKIITCGGKIPNIKVFVLESGRDNQDIYDYYAEHPEGTFVEFKNLDQRLFAKVTQHNTGNGNLRCQAVFNQNNIIIIVNIKPIGFFTTTQTINKLSIPIITNDKLGSNSVTIDKLSDDLQNRINQSVIFNVTATSDNTELLEYVNEHTADNVLIRYIGENRNITDVVSDLYIFAIERYTIDHIYTNNQILNTLNKIGAYRLYITANAATIQTIRPIRTESIEGKAIHESKLSDDVVAKLNSTLIQHIESELDDLKTPGIYLIQNKASGQRPGILLVAKEIDNINSNIDQTWIDVNTGVIKVRYYNNPSDLWQDWQFGILNGSNIKLGTLTENKLNANLRNKLVNIISTRDINTAINTGCYIVTDDPTSILVVYKYAEQYIYQTYYKSNYTIISRLSADNGVTWSEQIIKIDGANIRDKTITINKLADDVLPKNTSDLVNDSDFVTTTEVDNRIKQIVGAAPEALDTLEEIAAKLTDNDDIHAGLVNSIANKASKEELNNIAATIPNIKVFEINNTNNSELFNYIKEHGHENVYIKYNLTYDGNVYNYLLKIIAVNNNNVILEKFITPQRYIYSVTVFINNFAIGNSELSYAALPNIDNTKIVDKTITSDKLANGVIPDVKLFVVSNDSDNTALFEYINADADNYRKVIISYQTSTASVFIDIDKVINEGCVRTNSFKFSSDFINIFIYTNRCRLIYESNLHGRNIANNTIEETKLSSDVKTKLNSYQYFELQYNYDDRNIEIFQKIYEALTAGKNIFVGVQESDLTVQVSNNIRIISENRIELKFIDITTANNQFAVRNVNFNSDGSYNFITCSLNGALLLNNTVDGSIKLKDKSVTKEKLSDEVLNILNGSKFFVIEVNENKVSNLTELQNLVDLTGPEGDRPIGITQSCIVKDNGKYYPILPHRADLSVRYWCRDCTKVISLSNGNVTTYYNDFKYISENNIFNNAVTINKLSQEVIDKLNNTPTKTSQLTNDSNFATTEDINTAINKLIDNAPEEFNTLKEISEALKDDQDTISGLVTIMDTKPNKTDLSNVIGDITNNTVQLKDRNNNELYPITNSDQVKIGNSNLTECIDPYINIITDPNVLNTLDKDGIYRISYDALNQLSSSLNWPVNPALPSDTIVTVSHNSGGIIQEIYSQHARIARFGVDTEHFRAWQFIYINRLANNTIETKHINNNAISKEKLATDLYNELVNESKVFTISIDNKETTELFNYLENGGDTNKVIIKLIDEYMAILAIAGIYSYNNNTVTTNPVIMDNGVFMIEFYKANDYNYVPYNINGLYIDTNSIDINKLHFDPYERSNNPIATINNLTALVNAPNKYGTYRLNINNNTTLDVDTYNLNEAYIIIKNTSTVARQIAIPISDNVISMSGDLLQIPARAYIELSIIKDTVNNISYIRFA